MSTAVRGSGRGAGRRAAVHWRHAAVLLMLGGALLTGRVHANDTPAEPQRPVLALLQEVQAAARQQDYAGVFTYQQGSTLMSSRIVHVVDGTGERERLELLDGEPREYVRHNDVVQCLLPRKRIVLRERGRDDRFPGLLIGEGDDIDLHYRLRQDGELGRVAGRDCTVSHLVPQDGQRYGYRLCTDAQTHLLLKVQILSLEEGVIDQISFTSLQVGKDVSPEQLASGWDTQGWQVRESSMAPADLAAQGWRMPIPHGFRTITQLSRPMPQNRQVSQWVLSDGLAAISVFIEPYDEDHDGSRPTGVTHRRGALSIHKTRVGDFRLTTLGEVPPGVLRDMAERTQFVPPASVEP